MELWMWVLVGFALSVLTFVVVAWWIMRRLSAPARSLGDRLWSLPWRAKGQLVIDLVQDERVPLWARVVIPALIIYLALPLDLIPDFVPVIGQLDDLAVILIAGSLVLRAMPDGLLETHITRLEREYRPPPPGRAQLPPPAASD
jgi:uncharacterized membrane protein YkvA (DUF1232 family)